MPKPRLDHTTMPDTAVRFARQLGVAIAAARARRRWSQALLAEKAGISVDVLRAMEHGRLGTALGAVLSVLTVLGLTEPLELLLDPAADTTGRMLLDARGARRRVRPVRVPGLDLDF